MTFFIGFWSGLPFLIRVIVSLFAFVTVWWILGRGILWILSIIPFLLEKGFILLYQVIEIPISMLHKKIGGNFYKANNAVSKIATNTDIMLRKWYNLWHSQYCFSWKRTLIIYVLCIFFIVLPTFISVESKILKVGETWYVSGENYILTQLKQSAKYHSEQEVTVNKSANESEQLEMKNKQLQDSQIVLIVGGVNSSLLVRDIPDIKNGVALEKLHNGDKVMWNGELVFAEAENNHIETWAKVITKDGIEGWSRLFYLYSEDYEKTKFHVSQYE